MLDLPDDVVQMELKRYKILFDAGDKSRLIAAILFCGRQKIVMPDWVVDEFHKGTNNWYSMKEKELGAALGLEWPKGVHLNAMKKRRRLKFEVLNRVNAARNNGTPVDEELFSEIGKELGLGKTLVSEYYYAAKSLLPDFRKK